MNDQCKHGIRAPHECKDCSSETSESVVWLERIHDYADKAHTQDDGHCFALSEIVAMCRAALCGREQHAPQCRVGELEDDEGARAPCTCAKTPNAELRGRARCNDGLAR